MKNILYILILFPIFGISQEIKKGELKKMIKESISVNKTKVFSYDNLVLIADNTDSVFFKSNKIKVFTSFQNSKKYKFCRRLQLNFLDNKTVSFQDCQNCKEPTSCYVVTEKTLFSYKILEINDKVFLQFQNKYGEFKFEVTSGVRDGKNKIIEFELKRT